jgi:hypothetical protein
MERQECGEQKEGILSFCAGVAGAAWWLVAGLATRMAGLACARAHRVTEGALRVRDIRHSL